MTNLSRVELSKENPGALAGATGARTSLNMNRVRRESILKRPGNAMAKYAKGSHKVIAKMIGYCLTMGTSDGWVGFSVVARIRLTEPERAALAYAALNSLPPEQATMTAAASIGGSGAPLPTFLGGVEEARCWAAFATRNDLRAYALAAFEAMEVRDKAAFFRCISEIEVAA